MPWFRVSDDLPSRPQTTRIPRAHRRSAMGLWVLAGSWSAQQLTDGHVPAYMLEELCGTPEDAGWLVTAGYWTAVDDGWQFIDWAPDQPLREVVLEARRKTAERVNTWRARNKPRNAVTPPVTNAVTNAPVTLPPSLPDPSLPIPNQGKEKELVQPAAERSNALESEFEQWWEVCWRKQAKPDAFKAFKTARKDTDLATLIAGAQVYKLATIGLPKDKTKMPAGWLRDRRWEDEQVAYTAPLTRSEQNLAVVAQYAARERVDPYAGRRVISSLTPEQRAMRTMNLALSPAEALARECSLHTGYPLPCEACNRERGGNEF